MPHDHYCNCEQCCYARGGEICGSCGCTMDVNGCPHEIDHMADILEQYPELFEVPFTGQI